ncbi:nitrate reductase [Endozoicomonas ascidiicola]|uniref:nitrate reductase n=1 Tax=Endozoicomonas ascidiicola TaxID=1698521 RepID=UPI00082DDA2B|nr:nitrate reductase [Endozoicomonas ascidiicola]
MAVCASVKPDFSKTINTTCAYCGVGCGITASVSDPDLHLVEIKGREDHPANYGRLCSKGSALGETVSLEGRLLHPKIHGKTVVWPEALDEVTRRLQETIQKYGPDAVAFYGSGQLLTEDYYVANKLMKGFIGSANMDTNSRLCMASTVAGQKRAFGSDTVPNTYQDLEMANLLILVGSNTAWCHPVLFQRIRAMKEQRPEMKVVVIDPRKTDTCDIADLHLPIRPGTDALLFNGLLSWLAEQGTIDLPYIEKHTNDFGQSLEVARASFRDYSQLSELCGLDQETVLQFFHWFSTTEKTVTAWSQGVNQSSSGTDKVNGIINCHLATGRIGLPGSGPLSLTGQPNAMGGREVGGLANQLAAHMDFLPEDIDRVGRFWGTTNMARSPGKTAVDLFRAIDRGAIRFLWVMGTNPVVSMPDGNSIIKALKKCPTVVVSDCIEKTDTTALADIVLPAAPWSEKDGTVTNSERRISRQRALFPLAGGSKPDWWILTQVAKRLGYSDAFDFASSADIFREHAALSGFENNTAGKIRDFNIGTKASISDNEYESMDPFQWPVIEDKSQQRLFSAGGFYTDDRRAKFVPTHWQKAANSINAEYPLLLNTGRVRDHWHTMTRTGLSPRLNQHTDEPFLAIHPEDAGSVQLQDQMLCKVSSEFGDAIVRVKHSEAQRVGEVFMPMHWTRQNSQSGFCGVLVNPVVDPVSKQPDLKHTPVKLEPFYHTGNGVLFSREQLSFTDVEYVTEVRSEHGFRYELAGSGLDKLSVLSDFNKRFEKIEYVDAQSDFQSDFQFDGCRVLWLDQYQVQAIWMSGEGRSACDRQWLQSCFGKSVTALEAWYFLSGTPPKGEDAGRQVCACFGVGENTICRTIRENSISDVSVIGEILKAGTNCGSCIPEIRQLLLNIN